MTENNPTQSPSESLSEGVTGAVDQFTLERDADAGLDAFAAQFVGAVPQNEEPEEDHIEDSEDAPTEHEEHVEDDAEDDEVEVAEAEDDDDSDQEGELEVVSYDDLKGLALEIGGEHYTPAQLKSMIGRMKAAGNNAREADQALKDAEVKLQEVKAQEAWIEQRMQAVQHSDQMHKIQAEYAELSAKIEKFEEEGDMYEVTVLERKQKRLAQEYHKAKAEVDAVESKTQEQKIAKARQGLEARGLAHLNNDGAETKAWVSYVQSKVDDSSEFQVAATTPAIAEAFEKARKWDEAKTGTKRKKLKTSGKTLKPGVNKAAVPQASKKKAEYDRNPDSYFLDLAKDVLS